MMAFAYFGVVALAVESGIIGDNTTMCYILWNTMRVRC